MLPRVSTLIIIHNFSAGSGHKPSATIDCLESIARWCQQIQAGSIGFQPVSSGDYGWAAGLSGPPISDCLDEKIEVGWWFDTGWKPLLLYAVAKSRRGRGRACGGVFIPP